MRRTISFGFCAVLALVLCFSGSVPAASGKRAEAPVGTDPSGNALLPDGFYITPAVAPGAIFQGLPTGLRADGSADADGAVTSALSPDGTALLISTTGYNKNFSKPDGTSIEHPVLDPKTGKPTSTTDRRAEWVFLYDVRGAQPVQKQRLNLPDTYNGLVWGPSGKRFYVSAGTDDRVYVYKASGPGTASADLTFVPDAPFVLLGHNSGQTSPISGYDGGIFKNTAVNGSIGQRMFITPFTAIAAGLAISPNGSTLYVANLENDSLSIVNTATRLVTKEVAFFKPGQTQAIGEMPYWIAVLSNSNGAPVKIYVTSLRDGQVLSVSPAGSFKAIKVGGEPNRILLSHDQHRLYVANGDLDEIEVINTASDVLTARISLARPGYPFKGSSPNSLALSPDGHTLYATLGGENAVAVIDVASLSLVGRIPTGWYPSSVNVSADGKRLFVVNMKANSGPNRHFRGDVPHMPPPPNPTHRNEYILALQKGGLLTIPVPDQNTLAYLSDLVDANNGFLNRGPDPMMAFLNQHIKHVIFIQKENRTYDQVLGDLGVGNGDPGRVQFPNAVGPNHHALAKDFVVLDNFYDAGDVSGDGWNWDVQGRDNDDTVRAVLASYGNEFNMPFDWNGDPRDINVALPNKTAGTPSPSNVRVTTLIDPSGKSSIFPGPKDITATEGADNDSPTALGGYIWDTVLRAGKSVRHYGIYSDQDYYSDPTLPQPSFFPIDRTPFKDNVLQGVPVRPALQGVTDPFFRGWDLNTPDQYRYEEWKREFDGYVNSGNLPDFEIMCLMMDHFGNFGSNVAKLDNPSSQFASNDYAVGRLVEAVSKSPYWKDTAIFIIEDDAQDGPDHVDAHRSMAYVLSAYTKRGAVVSTNYNTTSMVRTMEDILGVNYLGLNDANARPMSDVFTTTADLTPYTATIPGILCQPPVDPKLVPECKKSSAPITAAVKPLHNGAWWAKATKGFNFKHPDLNNAELFNRVLWKGMMGNRPYPGTALRHASYKPRQVSDRTVRTVVDRD